MTDLQLERWMGKFGDDYTKRNPLSEALIKKRAEVLRQIIEPLRPVGIIEIGCNMGINLGALLTFLPFPNFVCGVEPNEVARRVAEVSNLKVFPDCGQNLKFPDEFADMVFTSGVLIHCALGEAEKIVREMRRVSKKYLLFLEYFNKTDEEIEYRGETRLLWKRNWPDHFKAWGLGKQISCGFAGKDQGFDDVHWWVYKK
jgi:spore coat polysaccharide biosynthesis protein SpsF